MEYTRHYQSPLGDITLVSDGEAMTGLWFDGQNTIAGMPEKEHTHEKQEGANPEVFRQADRWLEIYFSGHEPDFTPPIRLKTTAFRKSVYEILLTIPFGRMMTYGEIAEKIAGQRGLSHMSAQAVGGAVSHNPLLLIIPCHRVVGAKGSLTGYAGGIDRKIQLLTLEQASNEYVRKLRVCL